MCIAIIKPKGQPLPSWETFETCFNGNPDGAGFAYSTGKVFVIRKGLQTFEAFKAAVLVRIAAKGKDWALSTPMAFHFRIGTHGSQDDPKHTHPFPVSDSLKSLESLHIQSKQIAMHNGILSSWGTSHYAKKDPAKASYSDTMDFIANFATPLSKAIAPHTSLTTNKHTWKLIDEEVSGSRFVVMDPDGTYALWGQWVSHKGCRYSNSGYHYVPPARSTFTAATLKSYTDYSGYSDWEDVDDCGWERNRSRSFWPPVTETSITVPKTPAPKIPACTDFRKLISEDGSIDFGSILGLKCSREQALETALQIGLSYVPSGTTLQYGKGTKSWVVPNGNLFFRGGNDLYEFDGIYSILYFEMSFERLIPVERKEAALV